MIKPDGVTRGLEKEISSRLLAKGLKIIQQKKTTLTAQPAVELYKPHFGKSFYDGLVKFITSGPVVLCLVEGEAAITKVRALMGGTDPRSAEKGTIRGDLKEGNVINEFGVIKNLVHGSDSKESAEREISIFF